MTTWVLSPLAASELAEILDYVADDSGSQQVVERVLADLVKAFEQLAASPAIGFRRPRLTGQEVRWWPVRRYLVIYDPRAVPLRILRVIHGARDLTHLLEGDKGG